jgi:lipopolysaccharide transport system ATP-binding protein
MSSEVAVRIDGVSKRYPLSAKLRGGGRGLPAAKSSTRNGQLWALKEVSFRIYKGETLGAIGRNGAGKTTLLRIISGITEPTTGSVEAYGSLAPVMALQSGFNLEFSGRENIHLKCAIMGLSRDQTDHRLDEILDFASIGEFIDRPLKTYSQGMRARLAFAVAIHVDPEILVIDEVLAVGDEAFHRKCIARIAALKERGTTILFVSHSPAMVLQLCDRAILLDKGELLVAGDPKLVVSSYQRFVYSPLEQRPRVRADLLALASADSASKSEPLSNPLEYTETKAPAPAPRPDFDPSLVPQSTSESVPQGAQILETAILESNGKRVNLLAACQEYTLVFRVNFPAPGAHARFAMTVKTVEGLEVAGAVSHREGKGVDFVAAGTKLLVKFPFAARLAPATYFVDVRVFGEIDGRSMQLHHILDAVAFRVAGDAENVITGLADISLRPICEITQQQATRQAGGAAGQLGGHDQSAAGP